VNKKLVFILAIDRNLFKILTLNRNKKLMIIAISVFNVLNSIIIKVEIQYSIKISTELLLENNNRSFYW